MADILSVEDQGMWRGKHCWQIRMQADGDIAAVQAHGDTEKEAIADATETFTNRRVWTDEQKATMRRTNQALIKGLSKKGKR